MRLNSRSQIIAFMIGSSLMLPIFFGRDWVIGNDSPYHIIMARYPASLALADSFQWLQWTLFRDSFVNHHLGFQFLLYPFVLVSDLLADSPIWGAQAAVLLCAGLTSLCFFRLLAYRRVAHPLLWVVLLGILPWQFWMRQGFVRAPMVALPMMLLAIELVMRKKSLLLGIWSFCFMVVYFGAVLYGVVVGCMIAGLFVAAGLERRSLAMLCFAGAGLALGFLAHPSFPENIAFMKVQLFDTGFSAAKDIGSEWKPPPTRAAIMMWWPLLTVWGAALIYRLKRGGPVDGIGIGLILLSFAFLLLYGFMRRFVEYTPVFVLISAADLARLDLSLLYRRASVPIRTVALTAMIAAGLSGPLQARSRVTPSFDQDRIKPAMHWLIENTPVDSMVFTDDWDLFPMCFYFNRHNTYAVGLDPMFTARPYPEMWRRYRMITRGKAPVHPTKPGKPSLEDIRTLFSADYVLVMNDHKKFYRALTNAPDLFELTYPGNTVTDQPPAAIFRVTDR